MPETTRKAANANSPSEATINTATRISRKSVRSMLDVSEYTAGVLYYVAGFAVLFGSLIALVGGGIALWADGVRDKYDAIREAGYDVRIANANAAADHAREGLAGANLAIEDRKKENAELQKQLATLETAAANAETARLAMEKGLEETKQQTIKSLETANAAHMAVVVGEIEQRWASRDFWPRTVDSMAKGDAIRALEEFAGTKFFVETLPDTEPARDGRMIEKMLVGVKWERLRPMSTVRETDDIDIRDGITIEADTASTRTPLGMAAASLDMLLMDSGVFSMHIFHIPRRRHLPPTETRDEMPPVDALRITVGLRPESHFKHKKFLEDAKSQQLRWMSMDRDDPERDAKQPEPNSSAE